MEKFDSFQNQHFIYFENRLVAIINSKYLINQ